MMSLGRGVEGANRTSSAITNNPWGTRGGVFSERFTRGLSYGTRTEGPEQGRASRQATCFNTQFTPNVSERYRERDAIYYTIESERWPKVYRESELVYIIYLRQREAERSVTYYILMK